MQVLIASYIRILVALGMAALSSLLISERAAAATPDGTGGGFTDAGLQGAYYANPDLEGEPSFIRRDVRIDFDWGEVRPVGGSTAEPYRSFPTDGFSARWSGRIIARFDESYTFLGEADDGIRIRIRARGESDWKTVVDRWNRAGAFESQPLAMRANELYHVQVEYREREGNARCRLMWRSASTPTEVIDPVRQQGINITHHQWPGYLWADSMKSARYGKGSEKVDANAWPTASGVEVVVSEMIFTDDPQMSGTYLLRFRGQAEVRQDCCVGAVFRADGQRLDRKLPKGVGYDPSTNTTTSLMTLDGSRSMLTFDDAQRTSTPRSDGVSDIQLMRPIAQGSARHHRPGEIVYRPFKRVIEEHFTVVRFVGMPPEGGGDWSKRTLPDYAFFIGSGGKENWEYVVMLANETGRDLYITIPIGADDEYLEKLALLLRYGSNGREPYPGPTTNPVYPPLNPNLRVYVEMDNEIWNWGFSTTQVAKRLTQGEYDRSSSTWNVIDYDGRAGDPGGSKAMRRWHAVRTVSASQAFRRVWGNEAMGSRVRVLIEYQYDNYQNTAVSSLNFIDGYYNNRVDTNVSDPHPVAYFLWGAGGAAYYGLANRSGLQTHTLVRDASFETVSLERNTVRFRPRGTAWTFEGQAGLIRPEHETPIDGFSNLPAPTSGKQAAFLLGMGSISQRVRFAKPGAYAIAFRAAGAGGHWPGFLPFDILLDGRKISPRQQYDSRVSPGTALIGGWARSINSLDHEWGSAVFHIDKPGFHTITFVGRKDAPDYLLVDAIRMASADAMMTSGFDKGEAEGQEGEPDFAYQLETQARYARSFGLQVVAYEAGWSLGGDLDQRPIHNWCKFEDPRAKSINDEAIELWDRSGSFLTIWGVYQYWPAYDFAGAEGYPIMRSFREAAQRLRDEPTYGRSLPATLRLDDTDWSRRSESNGSWWRRHIPWLQGATDQWHAWMLIAPKSATYAFRVMGGGSGRVVVEVDGETIGELSSLDGSGARLRTKLTKGAHSVRIVLVGSDVELDRIDVRSDQMAR